MYIAIDDLGSKDLFEIDRALIVKTWEANVAEPGDEDNDGGFVEFEEEWGDNLMIVGSKEQAESWLKKLAESGKVSDTEETMCWALAETKEEAEELLKEEVAKFEE